MVFYVLIGHNLVNRSLRTPEEMESFAASFIIGICNWVVGEGGASHSDLLLMD